MNRKVRASRVIILAMGTAKRAAMSSEMGFKPSRAN